MPKAQKFQSSPFLRPPPKQHNSKKELTHSTFDIEVQDEDMPLVLSSQLTDAKSAKTLQNFVPFDHHLP